MRFFYVDAKNTRNKSGEESGWEREGGVRVGERGREGC